MEKEIEPVGIDISGYSEIKTDIQIDVKINGGQTVKQFNRIVKKTNDSKKKNPVLIFEDK